MKIASAPDTALQLEPDAWLAGLFGHPVFRIAVPDALTERPLDILGPLRGLGVRDAFCYTRVPTDRPELVAALGMAGFQVVDVNLTLDREPGEPLSAVKSPCSVRGYEPVDLDRVLTIAETCFRFSRFHLDTHMPPRLADAIKREWVKNYARRLRGERLLVADKSGQVVGFLAVLASRSEGHATRVIDLVGVDASCQKQGAGRSLVQAFVHQCGPGCDVLRVGTQAANVPSLRLYEACGFRMVASAYVLHAHIKEGQILR